MKPISPRDHHASLGRNESAARSSTGEEEQLRPRTFAESLGRQQAVEDPGQRRRDPSGERSAASEEGCGGVKRRRDQRHQRGLEPAADKPPDVERVERLVGDHHASHSDAGGSQRINRNIR